MYTACQFPNQDPTPEQLALQTYHVQYPINPTRVKLRLGKNWGQKGYKQTWQTNAVGVANQAPDKVPFAIIGLWFGIDACTMSIKRNLTFIENL